MNKVLTPFLCLAFFADFLDAFGPLGLFIKFGVTLTFLLVYLPSAIGLRRGRMGAAALVAIYLLYCLSRFTTLPSSSYELVKLMLAVVLVLGCINASRGAAGGRSAPAMLEDALRRALPIALAINGLFVLIQIGLGNGPLMAIGVPADYFDSPEKQGRFSGLVLNLPLWSSMLFVRILRADRRLFPRDTWHAGRWQMAGLYGLLLLSGQKYVLLYAILHLLLRLSRGKRMAVAAALIAAAPLLGTSENSQIADRINQAGEIAEAGTRVLIAEADADVDYPQFRFLDLRLNSWLYAWANIQVHPSGLGLGTWGDFSASLNTTLARPVTLSETQWGHLIVEQGYGALLLMFLMSTPFLFSHPALRTNLKWLGFYIFVAGWFTMGSNDYLWFFVTYALLFNLRALGDAAPSKGGSGR